MSTPLDPRLDAIRRLLARADRARTAEQRLRERHPDAPALALSTLAFHLYTDGTDALVELLVEQEQVLAGVRAELSYGSVHHVLYHLYNATLAERLLAPDRATLAADLGALLSELADEQPDLDGVRAELSRLCAGLEAHAPPPELD